ncbi:retrovirus-related pol polyprotein from transposon TNT 1-94 [Tanacetum coccineum]
MKLSTGRLVNGLSCDGIDMVIKNLYLEPKTHSPLALHSVCKKGQQAPNPEAKIILSQGLPRHIFNNLNQTSTAKEIWENVEMLMQGSGRTIQQRKEDLFDEYERFRAIGNESIHDYFVRFHKLVNDMKITQLNIPTHQMNTKFVNNLPAYWGKYVTNVKQNMEYSHHTYVYRSIPSKVQSYEASSQKELSRNMSSLQTILLIPPNDRFEPHLTQIANLLSGFQKQFPPTNNQLRTSSNSKTHATVHDGQIVTEPIQRKAPGNVGNTEPEAFPLILEEVPNAILVAFMANLSSTSATNSQVNENLLTPEAHNVPTEVSADHLCILAKRAQNRTLYDADTLLHLTHQPVSIWDSEEVLVQQVVSMKKMSEKPGHVRPANGFYEKLNALMFVPQQELSREQAYWLPANERASQTSNPNNTFSSNIEDIIKERTTQKPDYVSEWCYDYAKQFVEQQLLRKQLQGKDDTIRNLETQINITRMLNVGSTKGSCDQQAFETDRIQLKDTITSLRIQLDGLKVEHVSLQRRQAKAQVTGTTSSGPSTSETPKVLAPGMYNLGSKYIPPPKRANWVKPTPLPKKKQVSFSEPPRPSHKPTQKPVVHPKKQTNVCVPMSTGVKPTSGASKTVPKRAPRNHSSLPVKSANARRVEAHHRTLNKKNRVDSNLLVKHSVSVSKLNNVCAACNKSLVFANHNDCLIMCDDSVNVKPHQTKRLKRQPKKEWKPIKNVGKPIKRVWKSISKPVASSKPQWKPTGRHFSLFEKYPLTRIVEPTDMPIELPPSASSSPQMTMVSRFTDHKLSDRKAGSKGISGSTNCSMILMSHPQLRYGGSTLKVHDNQPVLYHTEWIYSASPVCLLQKPLQKRSHGKSKKASHPLKTENTNTEVLHTLHMDLCGPMRTESINGKKYVLVIVDDYTRFGWVRFLRTKDETPQVIEKFIVKTQRALNATVRFVRTDNGTEFVNKTLDGWFESVGISHETSVPRSPQQNGVVERRNRTLMEAARTMLIFAKAPLFLWAEAVATACYTLNRSLVHTLHGKTYYELLKGKKPNLQYFRVFGSLCYPTNDYDDVGKLKAKADIGIFVGYAPTKKAYRIYNKRTRKIQETVHVAFDELTEGLTSVQTSSGLAPQQMTSVPNSIELELTALQSGRSRSELVKDPEPPSVLPIKKQVDDLFQWFDDDEVILPPAVPIPPVNAHAAQVTKNAIGSPSTTVISEGAPAVTESLLPHLIPLPDTSDFDIETLFDHVDSNVFDTYDDDTLFESC